MDDNAYFKFLDPNHISVTTEARVVVKSRTQLYYINNNKNSSEDEIANVNFLRRYGTYVLQNTKKENLLRLTN